MDEGDWGEAEDHSEDLEALFEFEKVQKKDQFASVKRRLDFSPALDGTKGKDIIVDYKLPKSLGTTKEPSNKRRYETDENVPPDNENRDARKVKRRKVAPVSPVKETSAGTKKEQQVRLEYSTRPLETPCIPVVSWKGRRVYVPIQPEKKAETALDKETQLLSVPISFLLENIRQEERQTAMDCTAQETKERPVVDEETNERTLWVDKYGPRTFMDLLSDEKTNREVLQWVKGWDECVFKKKTIIPEGKYSPKSTTTSGRGRGAGRGRRGNDSGSRWGNSDSSKTSQKEQPRVTNEADSRPEKKIILLAGPPGLGKTTLAHVVAKQAGYNPVEMNASDDRSEAIFMSKVFDATQMKSVFGDNKPNCLIIDEIDGVAGGEKNAVNQLLKLVTGSGKRKDEARKKKTKGKQQNEGNEEGAAEAQKKKGKKMEIQRPIICICNDQYAPSLRQLRNYAQVFRFDRPKPDRLAQRLKEICAKEGLRADFQTLYALAELTDCDIRSSLNTLQFLRRRTRVLTAEHLATGLIGHKDISKSLFDTWKEIFTRPPESSSKLIEQVIAKQNKEEALLSATLGYTPQRNTPHFAKEKKFVNFYDTLSSSSDCEKVIDGCFENYLRLDLRDVNLEKAQQCLDYLVFTDELSAQIRRNQNFSLRKYLPTTPLTFQRLCSESSNPYIHLPQTEFQVRQETKSRQSMVQTYMQSSLPEVQQMVNPQVFVLEYVSPLLDILSPKIRELNPQLLSGPERDQLDRMVDIHLHYNLGYTKHNSKDGGDSTYSLDPPLDSLVSFGELAVYQQKRRPSIQKEMLVYEIEAAKIKRAEERMEKILGSESKQGAGREKQLEPKAKPSPVQKKATQTQLLRNTQKLVAVDEPVEKDFFGRPIAKKSPQKSPAKAKGSSLMDVDLDEPAKPAVFYKFHEGFTNAVKRTVRVKDFL